MSYTDGISNLQQVPGSIATAAAQPARQVSGSGDAAKQSEAAKTSVQADSAEVSAAGGLISKALEGSDVRSEKVQALQQAIASGSYHVSSSDVAAKLIDSLMD